MTTAIPSLQLKAWLKETCVLGQFTLQPLINDASFRQYFRLKINKQSYIVMTVPLDQENIIPFIVIARGFLRQGIHVPEILDYNLKNGFILLSDLGDALYFNLLNKNTAEDLYTRALSVIPKIQAYHPGFQNSQSFGSFNETLIRFELGLFVDWFLHKHLKLPLSARLKTMLERIFKILVTAVTEQPQVCIHRDYHSRNLLLVEKKIVGVLDFQDALYGPITYDAVSLLRDAYIDWPNEQVEKWGLAFYHTIAGHSTYSVEEFLRWFDLTGMQRHLKILGVFARLYYRDNKPHYLTTTSRLLRYLNQICEKYPELTEFKQLLQIEISSKLHEKEKK